MFDHFRKEMYTFRERCRIAVADSITNTDSERDIDSLYDVLRRTHVAVGNPVLGALDAMRIVSNVRHGMQLMWQGVMRSTSAEMHYGVGETISTALGGLGATNAINLSLRDMLRDGR